MAAIDKIYGTCDEWIQLYEFLKNSKPEYLNQLYRCPDFDRGYDDYVDMPLSNFSVEADKWLYQNCPLKFVKKTISSQYGSRIVKGWEDKNRKIKNIK